MIDKWFVNDIETALKVQGKAVVTDAKRLCGNLVGISINLCKSIQKELFINDTP